MSAVDLLMEESDAVLPETSDRQLGKEKNSDRQLAKKQNVIDTQDLLMTNTMPGFLSSMRSSSVFVLG